MRQKTKKGSSVSAGAKKSAAVRRTSQTSRGHARGVPAAKAPVAKKAPVEGAMPVMQAKKTTQRQGFKVNEFIVYPAHGVGQILAIEEQEVAGAKLELFVINFIKDKMTLRVPTAKIVSVSHFLNAGLSLNCLKSCVSSLSRPFSWARPAASGSRRRRCSGQPARCRSPGTGRRLDRVRRGLAGDAGAVDVRRLVALPGLGLGLRPPVEAVQGTVPLLRGEPGAGALLEGVGGALPGAGVLLLVLAATRIEPLRSDSVDFLLLDPAWLAVLGFGVLALFQGMLVAALAPDPPAVSTRSGLWVRFAMAASRSFSSESSLARRDAGGAGFTPRPRHWLLSRFFRSVRCRCACHKSGRRS